MSDLYLYIQTEHAWFFRLWFFLLGACVGSFLNVCIYRIPAEKSVVSPGSRCGCGRPIRWFDNIPILSWFLLRGRARCCGARFSVRYPLVEAITAGLFLLLWMVLPPAQALPGMLFFSLLLVGTFIDFDTMLLPDVVTIWGAVVGVALSFAVPGLHGVVAGDEPWLVDAFRSGTLAILGALVGSGIVLWLMVLAEAVLRKEAMGFGDVVFMGCIGAFCGWKGAIFAVFGGAVCGTLVVIPLMLFQRLFGKEEAAQEGSAAAGAEAKAGGEATAAAPADAEAEEAALGMGSQIPFGPWLALGGALYYLFLRGPVDAYIDGFKQVLFG